MHNGVAERSGGEFVLKPPEQVGYRLNRHHAQARPFVLGQFGALGQQASCAGHQHDLCAERQRLCRDS